MQVPHPVMFAAGPSREACAEFKIGIRSFPHLAEHGFQDMVVLPGSFYVEMALAVHRDLFKSVPGIVRNVIFQNPVVLSEEETVITVQARDTVGGPVEYTFFEGRVQDGRNAVGPSAARLEIDRDESTSQSVGIDTFSIDAFQTQSDFVIDSERFYKQLRDNGNQYGSSFQHVSSIWRAGNQTLGRLTVPRRHNDIAPDSLTTILLDSITQLLAGFVIERRKTFVLRSIEKIELMDVNFPDTLWGHATRVQKGEENDDGFVGNVQVFDQSGQSYMALWGVAFTYLDAVALVDQGTAANQLCIAANFTAEPLQDSLRFWAEQFATPLNIEFAPYNQIFQQLLDTRSAFHRNRHGVNVILLRLEEWIAEDRRGLVSLNKKRAQQCFGDRATYVLPNGLEIVQWTQYETDYLYKEIFADQRYVKHGIRLRDRDTVVDIGANIGLFSLFVMSRCAAPRILAYEPSPVVFQVLKANCDAYGSNVRAFNVGVSDKAKSGTFTFYEKSSVFSGFHPNLREDQQVIQTVVRNMLNSNMPDRSESVEGYVNELTADRLRRSTYQCPLTCISDIIRENQLDRIDLLKIDAEKSELDIIEGIDDGDWQKIDQIVIEVHDRTREAVARIENLLINKGYRCVVEQDSMFEHSGLFNLYATRAAEPGNKGVVTTRIRQARQQKTEGLAGNIQELCAAMRSFASRAAAPLVLALCPASPATEADVTLKTALDNAERTLLSEAPTIANVHIINTPARLQLVSDYYDPQSHQLGDIPYTPKCYAAIGTTLFRTIFNLRRTPFKVIVLDCDNTLWKGTCGEDGPLGIQVTEPFRTLQAFMIEQMNAGMLLCLCSRNNEADVIAVFDHHPDMVLKREHLVSRRIDWNSKAANIKSLATELNLGLDSFVFIDDNPVDCADVTFNCPGVLTLQMPRDTESVTSFLNNLWVLDRTRSTQEDHNRTRMYQEHTEREHLRAQTSSLTDFIKGLQLRVDIAEATSDQLSRVSQLTFRTNQFNFTTIRRSEHEVRDYLQCKHAKCLVVRVADRFGDYGISGVVMYETEVDRYKVDTLLLSCRVLGRGVEHSLLASLGQRAVGEGKRFVELTYLPTAKNLPALEFIRSIGDQNRDDAGASGQGAWTFPADRLSRLEFSADRDPQSADVARAIAKPATLLPRPRLGPELASLSDRMQRAAETLCDIDQIAKAIDEYRFKPQRLQSAPAVPASNALEAAIADIWRRVLGEPHMGFNENFLDAGGTSLKAVQVIAMIKRELKQDVSIVTFFECPTVTLLAAQLTATSGESTGGSTRRAAVLRGQQRRSQMLKRKIS